MAHPATQARLLALIASATVLTGFNPLRSGDDPNAPPLRFSAGYEAPVHIHSDGYSDVAFGDLRAAMEGAMSTWEVRNSTFTFGQALNGRDGDTPAIDGFNVIRFETRQLPREVDPNSVLAFTSPVSAACSGILLEVDITFNAVTVAWSTADRSRRSDIETIALHEFGHFLGLDHTNDADAVMFPSIQERVRRDLHPDDLAGVRSVYPPGRGLSCGRDADCGGGEVCVFSTNSRSEFETFCSPAQGRARPGQACDGDAEGCLDGCANGLCFGETCSAICTTDNDCPAGRSCIPQNVGDGLVVPFCLELTLCEDDLDGCPRGQACTIVEHPTEDRPLRICTEAGPRALGQPCDSADQCAGAVCTGGTCSKFCDDDCPAPFECIEQQVQIGNNRTAEVGLCEIPEIECVRPRDCDEGFACTYVSTGAGPRSRCLPSDAAPAGEPCAGPADCRAGICLADGQCSDVCRNEADCPLHMVCGRAAVSGQPVPACVPLPPDAAPPPPIRDIGVADLSVDAEDAGAPTPDATGTIPRDGGPRRDAETMGDAGGIVVRRVGDGGGGGCQAQSGPGAPLLALGMMALGLIAIRRRRL